MNDERDQIIADLKEQIKTLQSENSFIKEVSDGFMDRLYAVMNNSPQTLIVFFDKELKAEDFNSGFFELLGYKDENKFNQLHNQNIFVLTSLLEKFRNRKNSPSNERTEATLISGSGKKVEFTIYLSKIVNPENEENGYLAIGYDITKQKRMKVKLEKSNLQLIAKNRKIEEADRYKTEFFNNITHELRTPLSGVIGVIKLIRTLKIQNEPLEKNISIIENNSKHLLTIINQLLDISRIEAGKMSVAHNKIPLAMLAYDAEVLAKSLLIEKPEVEFSHTITNPAQQFFTDHGKMRQIITNLIGNAVKFTKKGQISFSAKIEKDLLEIRVKDSGIGIAKADLDKIFMPFVQADGSITKQYGGTGLGLAITLKLVKLLNGKISVKSTIGEGSEFLLLFKIKQPDLL